MKIPIKTALAALAGQGGQALAQDRDMTNPCAGQEGIPGAACRGSLEIVTTDTALPEVELLISVKAARGNGFIDTLRGMLPQGHTRTGHAELDAAQVVGDQIG